MKERGKSGFFVGTNDRMLKGTPTKGGVYQELIHRCTPTAFSYLSYSAVVIIYSSASPVPIQGNRGGRERPPPKAGGHVAPIAALVYHAPIRPHAGSLSSLWIPAGRLGIAPRRGAETTETDL